MENRDRAVPTSQTCKTSPVGYTATAASVLPSGLKQSAAMSSGPAVGNEATSRPESTSQSLTSLRLGLLPAWIVAATRLPSGLNANLDPPRGNVPGIARISAPVSASQTRSAFAGTVFLLRLVRTDDRPRASGRPG